MSRHRRSNPITNENEFKALLVDNTCKDGPDTAKTAEITPIKHEIDSTKTGEIILSGDIEDAHSINTETLAQDTTS